MASPVVDLGRISAYESSPGWSFGLKPQSTKKVVKTPGPMTYMLPAPHLFAYSLSPRVVTFAKSKRAIGRQRKVRSPDPASYNIPSTLNLSAQGGASLKGRWPQERRAVTVGPGAYNVHTQPKSTLGGYIGRKYRPSTDAWTLGPGTYNTQQGIIKGGFSFSKATKSASDNKGMNDTPAPGFYTVDKTLSTSAVSFKGNRRERKKSINDNVGVMFTSFKKRTTSSA
jgi:hypothetical protein